MMHSRENNKSMKKRAVRFGNVTELSFPRQQGHSCIPSKGDLTLGMAKRHCSIDHFTIDDYEKKKLHRVYREKFNISSHNNQLFCDKSSMFMQSPQCLQPIGINERLLLLKEAGVEDIDDEEKDDCNFIRNSREICGCECRDYCDPDVCSCILAEIPCQIERANFPCGCTTDNCKNPNGCNIYNLTKVQTHYHRTIKKLKGNK
ncbi:unnamed protein product [Brassicogethes aeneus]|uniref:Cysteine/serine-rich nuclear protein N-terminal domain-containing protein n=1 Tax=Brassicogethes aeneus TaxID=1431903 RepID=A0A9P0BCK0_BRAAE|nr:unnamed protein product [Brassicogethes aeneus]